MQRALDQARRVAAAELRAHEDAQRAVARAMTDQALRFNTIAEIRRTVRNQRPPSARDFRALELLRPMFDLPAG